MSVVTLTAFYFLFKGPLSSLSLRIRLRFTLRSLY